MTIEKLKSGSYRIKQMEHGITYRITVDHKPSKAEAMRLIMERSNNHITKDMSFQRACESYIESKDAILSPSTRREYLSTMRNLPDTLMRLRLSQITTMVVQKVVNDMSKGRSPKTVANYSGFIMSVLKAADVDIKPPQLPQKEKKSAYIPSEEDIKAVFEQVKGTKYEIPLTLAAFGLRRSEICALTIDDVRDCRVTINKALVQDENKNWVVKKTKTTDSTREVIIPESLYALIQAQGHVYNGMPDTLYKELRKAQDRANTPHFSLHKMRHFFASFMHQKGYTDKQIQEAGGWKTDNVLKTVYQHAMDMDKAKRQMSADISSLLD